MAYLIANLGLANLLFTRLSFPTPRSLGPYLSPSFARVFSSAPPRIDPQGVSYFQLLGADEKRFRVNTEKLSSSYKELQRKWHPDKFSTRSLEEQQYASTMSALVNTAYNVLMTPHLRAKYMLEQHGEPLGEDDTAAMGAPDSDSPDPDFLMKMVDLRERIASADETCLRDIHTANSEALEQCYRLLETAFSSDDMETARKETVKLQYLRRIADELHQRLPTDSAIS